MGIEPVDVPPQLPEVAQPGVSALNPATAVLIHMVSYRAQFTWMVTIQPTRWLTSETAEWDEKAHYNVGVQREQNRWPCPHTNRCPAGVDPLE